MGKIAFFDITEGSPLKGATALTLYIIEKGTVVSAIASKDGEPFAINRGFEDIEESVVSLPLSILDIRLLELPFSDPESIAEVLPYELDPIVLGGSENIVFDALVIGKTNGKYKVLVAYAPKEILKEIITRLKDLGVEPKTITSIELAAIAQSIASGQDISAVILNPEPLSEAERMEGAVREAEAPFINLRKGEIAYTADVEQARRALKLSALLAMLIAIVLVADLGFSIITSKKQIVQLKTEIRKTYQGLFPTEKLPSDELYQMKAHIKALKDKDVSYTGIKPLELLLALASHKRADIRFTEITMDRERIFLKGEGQSLSEVQTLKGVLETVMTEPTITETKPSEAGTLFTITAKELRQ